jgi:hypothetical protein
MLMVLLLALVMPAAVMAQGDGMATAAVDWQFWAVLAVLLGVLFGASVVLNQYLMDLRERVPEWAKPYAPAAYQHASTGFGAGVDYLAARAKRTPTPLDDELVEIIDQNGRRLLVKAAGIVGHVPGGERNAGTFPGEPAFLGSIDENASEDTQPIE